MNATPDPPLFDPADDIPIRARMEQDLARRSGPGSFMYAFVLLAISMISGLHEEHLAATLGFAIAIVLAGAIRRWWSASFDTRYAQDPVRWRRIFQISFYGVQVVWSAFCVWIMTMFQYEWTSAFTLLATSGLGAGSTTITAPDRRLMRTSTSLLTLPLAVAALFMNKGPDFTLVGAILLYWAFALKMGHLQSNEYWAALQSNVRLHQRTQQLDYARRSAQQANAAKDEFLQNVSHELRTPMNGILGMVELAESSEPSPEVGKYLQIIRNSGRDLMEIITTILTFANRDNLTFRNRPIEIKPFFASVAAAAETRAEQKELRFHYYPDEDLPSTLVGDEHHIRHIMENVIGNAMKFTPRGQVDLFVSGHPIPGGLYDLHITVADTGIGIDPRHQRTIFDPFTQVDSSSTRSYGGLGMGLSVTRNLLEQMGGRIEVESEPGQGSRFSIWIQLGDPHALELEPDASPGEATVPV